MTKQEALDRIDQHWQTWYFDHTTKRIIQATIRSLVASETWSTRQYALTGSIVGNNTPKKDLYAHVVGELGDQDILLSSLYPDRNSAITHAIDFFQKEIERLKKEYE